MLTQVGAYEIIPSCVQMYASYDEFMILSRWQSSFPYLYMLYTFSGILLYVIIIIPYHLDISMQATSFMVNVLLYVQQSISLTKSLLFYRQSATCVKINMWDLGKSS